MTYNDLADWVKSPTAKKEYDQGEQASLLGSYLDLLTPVDAMEAMAKQELAIKKVLKEYQTLELILRLKPSAKFQDATSLIPVVEFDSREIPKFWLIHNGNQNSFSGIYSQLVELKFYSYANLSVSYDTFQEEDYWVRELSIAFKNA